ncbi:MAG: Ig-like domain-containing protein [Chitinophagaceae bacterium]|nr:Ig-like domain-containing protein [Chitinophagaceae bacterium]
MIRKGLLLLLIVAGCKKSDNKPSPAIGLLVDAYTIDGKATSPTNTSTTPAINIKFSAPVDRATIIPGNISFTENSGTAVLYNATYASGDKEIILEPTKPLKHLTSHTVSVNNSIQSAAGGKLINPPVITFMTDIDSTQKFPTISDDSLLTLVQKQTFTYFWDFAHPVSGLARERNTSGDLVTSGGSGFGIMSIIVGAERGFITKAQALTRLQTITSFLKNTAKKFKGAFPHWLNGATGAAIPFSQKDDGADLVETSYLMAGLLTARQYFNGAAPAEATLRADINSLYNAVEWSWHRKNNENVLYWHWSENFNFEMNHQIRGWNECLITYVLAASSTTSTIPKIVYDNGWAQNGGIKNSTPYLGITIPLGDPTGGPLFFSHYSFLGINPNGLSDQYANYQTQVVNHTRVNYEYSKANPKGHYGYSNLVWGLTASDIPGGYTASSPTNDIGVIAPTAALSSMPYTPAESMNALKFFYYTLGDKLWKGNGFIDAFSLKTPWFAESFLAIDQGPIIIMIENHRSQLIWNLFTSCPEVKAGLSKLGFTAPYL